MKLRDKESGYILDNIVIQLVEEREDGRYGLSDCVYDSFAEFENKWEDVSEEEE